MKRLLFALSKKDSRSPKTLGLFSILFVLLSQASLGGPLSERILLVSNRNGLDKLYICRPDGRDLKRFCKETGQQIDPHFCPALNRVFYVTLEKGLAKICSVDQNGKDFREELKIHANVRQPSVSPDGKTLLLSTDRWGSYELAELDLTSKKLTRLTYDQSTNTHPSYSPDGKSILFLTRRHGHSEVYLWRGETKGFKRLTDSGFHKGIPAWKPDGKRVVCTEITPPHFQSTLLEIDLESGKTRRFLPEVHPIIEPSYSVDGDKILFTEKEVLYTYDSSDTEAQAFPLRGVLFPKQAKWIPFPLP